MARKKQFTAYVLFGEECVNQCNYGEKVNLRDGNMEKRVFNTEEERNAYILGLNDAYGWNDFFEIEKKDYDRIRRQNR